MKVPRPGWSGVLVPAGLLLIGAAELTWLGSQGWQAALGLEALAAIFLVFRRTHTALAVPASAIALMAIPWTGTAMNEAATPIFFYVLGMYSLGRHLPLRGGLLVALLILGMVAVDFGFDPADNDITDAVFVLSLAVPPYVFGRVTRRLAVQSRRLAEQQEQLSEQAVRDERDRIARELHDVIAHSVSAMVVQTAAAQELLRTSPDRAARILDQVADTGRQALAQTGRLLHLIRDVSDELGLRPTPGLADLPGLVAAFRADGLDVDATLPPPAEPPPSGVDVSAYRVVQEVLTNALRYADGPVRLSGSTDAGALRITSSNAVSGRVSSTVGTGLGLCGMRERVELLGGTVQHSALDGRFELAVSLPLGAPP